MGLSTVPLPCVSGVPPEHKSLYGKLPFMGMKKAPEAGAWEIGAKDGARSRDNQIHNLGLYRLYQLSYFRHQVGQ